LKFDGNYNLSIVDEDNELSFVSMCHVFGIWRFPNLQPTLFGPFGVMICFHDELMCFLVQAMIYVTVGRAFMDWGSNPPYNFVTTNWKFKIT
jgi:hypothetical protein